MNVYSKTRKKRCRESRKIETTENLEEIGAKNLSNHKIMNNQKGIGQEITRILAQNTIPIIDLDSDVMSTGSR